MKNILMGVGLSMVFGIAMAQNRIIDENKMARDIEVAEDILNTLIKQQYSNQRLLFPVEIVGTYTSGYGVTFRLPATNQLSVVLRGFSEPSSVTVINGRDSEGAVSVLNSNRRMGVSADSLKEDFEDLLVEASRIFLTDYGDLISQLDGDDRILITNRAEGKNPFLFSSRVSRYLSIEGSVEDIQAYRQGKISRDELLERIHVVDSEVTTELEPDLEVLASTLSRLYQPDLSKTYFATDITYERLSDFGVIYYMQVYSSNEGGYKIYTLPTLGMSHVDQDTRDQKVKELYPLFEQGIKEDLVDYGRTVRSLNDDEVLVLNIKLTKCEGCGIPSSIELSVEESILKDYASGKLSRDSAISRINVKKGQNQ